MRKQIALLGVATIALSAFGFVGCTNNYYENAEKYTAGGATLTQTVTTLDISWLAGDIEISYGDVAGVSFSETAEKELSEKDQVHYWLAGTVLYIKYDQAKRTFKVNETPKSLSVVLPYGMELQQLDLESVDADVHLKGVKASDVDIESVSGEITGHLDGQAQEVSIETVSGDVELSLLCTNHLDVDTTSANVALTLGAVPVGSLDSVSGNLILSLYENAEFSVEFETASGKLNSEFSMTKNGDTYVCGKGGNLMEIETVSGNATIKKLALDA